MIRLISAPTALALARLQKCVRRAQEARDADEKNPDSVLNCYRHTEVKTSLLAETTGKCAYCESKITHVYWGDVEHIKPKDLFPGSRLEYDNLTIACAICNNKKSNYYSEEASILDSYHDIPENHLVGLGPLIWHRNGSQMGQRSVTLLELNRGRRLIPLSQVSLA